jgi:hypothetical protein
VVFLAIALVSIFVVAKPATDAETFKVSIESIDEKKTTVMGLTATAAAAATGLAAIPGDATTPIADQIMEISSWLLIVVCVLVLEKSLITIVGYLSFYILIPIACGMLIVNTFWKKHVLKSLGIKLIVFALVIAVIIPFSLKVSDWVYDLNKDTIETVTENVETETNVIEQEADKEEETEENKSWWQSALDSVKGSADKTAVKAKEILNKFVDAIAMFLITYCAIPLIVFFAVYGFMKLLFGMHIPMPEIKMPFGLGHHHHDDHDDYDDHHHHSHRSHHSHHSRHGYHSHHSHSSHHSSHSSHNDDYSNDQNTDTTDKNDNQDIFIDDDYIDETI